ncbi:MAG: four helix bundle protein [Ignavibacteriae bacterium]|nr:four helix bundle protein [Ignavibacteriota bacterium]
MENEPKKFLKLNDIEAYKIAFNLSNYIWDIVITWDIFAKKTIGEQYVDAVDSISANIAEGFGRYSKKDKIRFYRISFGSVFESLDWNQKSIVRNLLTKDQYNYIFNELQKLPKSINSLISFTNNKLQI